MGDSGSALSLISLPKGGGAMQGIGEKFSPDLHTGTGNFTVPIALPPGRNGFQPQVSLVYSTGNGNGIFGLGWRLSVPGVARKTTPVPRYRDDDPDPAQRDVFVLSGSEDLVPVEEQIGGAERVARYQPRTEGLFALIHRHRDPSKHQDYWAVRTKDGLVSYYGTNSAEGEHPAYGPAVESDPATTCRPDAGPADLPSVFAWNLTLTKDPFGNRIEYLYEARDSSDGADAAMGREWNQPLLTQIRYVDFDDGAQTKFLVTVSFQYESTTRPDALSSYRSGFEIRSTKRCTGILVETHADQDRKVRRYEFDYANAEPNGVSHLMAVRVVGFDDAGDATTELPPLTFGYTDFHPQDETRRDFYPLQGADLPASSLSNPSLELVGLFGNGLPDVLEMNGSVPRYWRNLGGGRFDLPRQMDDAPAGLALADPGVQLLDADGDGRIDLLVTRPELSGYFRLEFGALWDRRSLHRYANAPSFDLKDPEVKLVDLTGDGVSDALRSGARFECFFNDREHGWLPQATRRVERQALKDFPNVDFADKRVRWADMSGDQLQDIVLVHDACVEYWPNLGYGTWGRRIRMHNSPRFETGFDPRRILLGDVDGDGVADLIYVGDRRIHLWINQSGNGWSDEVVIEGTPPVSDMDAVRLVDLLGSGISGILWTRDADGSGRDHHFFVDLTGGTKPYLLAEMDNNLGALTKVAYTPSTRYYLDDQRRPERRWRTPLPFPVQVVSHVEVIDRISGGKLTTEYSYQNGYWDGTEPEIRGFGMVEQRNSESFADYNAAGLHGRASPFAPVQARYFSAPTMTRTWFHQGPIDTAPGSWSETEPVGYSNDDIQLLRHTTDVNAYLDGLDEANRALGLTSRQQHKIRHDAIRTLRGSILRTEVYGLDGSSLENRPYTVTENAYELREESAPADAPADRLRIFFPHPVAQRTTQWERGDDPLSVFSFTSDYDAYGQPRAITTVALPRLACRRHAVTGAVVGEIEPDETRLLVTHAITEYAQPAAAQHLRSRVRQMHTFEFATPVTVGDLPTDAMLQALRTQRNAGEAAVARMAEALRGWLPGGAVPDALRLVDHVINHYDGAAFRGRDDGLVDFGALVRSERLAFTDDVLARAYTLAGEDRRPDYLGGSAVLPLGPPAIDAAQVGYRREVGTDGLHQDGWYADTSSNQYDFQRLDPPPAGIPAWPRRGSRLGARDALGNESAITLDDYWLLPVMSRDPVGLETVVEYDYRVLRPRAITDPNRNCTQVRYTPTGLVLAQWAESKADAHGDRLGGREEEPDVKYTYDFLAYVNSLAEVEAKPIFVHSATRVWHASDDKQDDLMEAREYSDGFGRVIQRRAQAEDLIFGVSGDDVALPSDIAAGPGSAQAVPVTDSVVVNGWQAYDNKGRVVEKYEPFFSHGWAYKGGSPTTTARHAEFFYDPRGQTLRTLNPDGSQQRVVFGRPIGAATALTLPETVADEAFPSIPPAFAPTPWESYSYDANDLASISHSPGDDASLTSRAPESHHFTPASQLVDPLGRAICQVVRNGRDPEDWHVTRSAYDIQGNLIAITDGLGREAFQYAFDLQKRQLRVTSIDAGVRTTVPNAVGQPVEYRDSKGSLRFRAYDPASRPTQLWARDDVTQAISLRERIEYGDNLDRAANSALNRLGRPAEYRDEAGKVSFDQYDFKGNLISQTRTVISDESLANGWVADWAAPNSDSAIDPTQYTSGAAFDALNRPVEVIHPMTVATAVAPGYRPTATPRYNRAGALSGVELDGETYVDFIAYNAKGQRVLVNYGNSRRRPPDPPGFLMTRYAYDPDTFRLTRLRTERCGRAGDTWTGTGAPLQDFGYTYDLAGNITSIEERVPNCGIAKPGLDRDRLLRNFEYDPLYRLVSASGRAWEQDTEARRRQDLRSDGYYQAGAPVPNQGNAPDHAGPYTETFRYDPVGNILELAYKREAAVEWRRTFGIDGLSNDDWADASTNRLTELAAGQSRSTYAFDANGNLAQQNLEQFHDWDHADRMTGYRVQAGAAPTTQARYLYGAGGVRVKKWIRKNAAEESTVYIGEAFEHHRSSDIAPDGENTTVNVMDDQTRIARVRIGNPLKDDAGPSFQYQIDDHLGSSAIIVGGQTSNASAFINREEFFPFGETSLGSFERKRYRFAGKERDGENGLNYHSARYYAPWIMKWISCDPKGVSAGSNPYRSFSSNPINNVDPNGMDDYGVAQPSENNIAVGTELQKDPIAGYTGDTQQSFNPDSLGQPAPAACFGSSIDVHAAGDHPLATEAVSRPSMQSLPGVAPSAGATKAESAPSTKTIAESSPPISAVKYELKGASARLVATAQWLATNYPNLFPSSEPVRIAEGDPGGDIFGHTNQLTGDIIIAPGLSIGRTVETLSHELLHSRQTGPPRVFSNAAINVRAVIGDISHHDFYNSIHAAIREHYLRAQEEPGFDPRELRHASSGQAEIGRASATLIYDGLKAQERYGDMATGRVDERVDWPSVR